MFSTFLSMAAILWPESARTPVEASHLALNSSLTRRVKDFRSVQIPDTSRRPSSTSDSTRWTIAGRGPLGDVQAGAAAHAASVRLTPVHVGGAAIRLEPDHVHSAAFASKQPTTRQVWRATTARGHTGAELLPRRGYHLPGLCDLGGFLLCEGRRMGIRDDDPILRRTFASRLCADNPDAVPAKLQQNAGLQQCIPCRGSPILLAPPRDACLVAEISYLIER